MEDATRSAALERFERATELPLLLLALAMIPLLVLPLLLDLPSGLENAFTAVDWVIWAAFGVEYLIRLALVQNRWTFVRKQWPDLLILALPFLRPLRIVRSARALRLLRLGRLAVFMTEINQEGRRLLVRRSLDKVILLTGLVLLGCAVLVFAVEDGGTGRIDSFGDALWWAATTVQLLATAMPFP